MDLDESHMARLGIALQLLLNRSNITAIDLVKDLLQQWDRPTSKFVTMAYVQGTLSNFSLTDHNVHATLQRFETLPHSNNGLVPASVLIFLGILSATTVALRFYSRITVTGRVRVEDWVILGVLLLGLTMTIHFNVMVHVHGVGQHVWDNTFSEVRGNLLLIAWVFSEVYLVAISMVKLSFLVFYYHLGAAYRKFRWAVFLVAAFVILWLVVQLVIIIRICTPLNYWDHLLTATCLNRSAVYYVASSVNIFQDLAILLLPVYIVQRLNLSKREKFLVMSLFGLGGIVCIISISKMFVVQEAATSYDFTQSQTIFNTLSQVEVHLGVICCSIPTLRSMLSRSRQRISVQFHISLRKTSRLASTGPSAAHSSQAAANVQDNGEYHELDGHSQKSAGQGAQRDIEASAASTSSTRFPSMLRNSYGSPLPDVIGESSSEREPPHEPLESLHREPRELLSLDMHIATFEELEREMRLNPRRPSHAGASNSSSRNEGRNDDGGERTSHSDGARSNKSSTGTQRLGRLRRLFSSGS